MALSEYGTKNIKWTKTSAIAELGNLADQTRVLENLKRNCEEHIRWVAKTRRFLTEVFGQESTFSITFASFTWSQQGRFVIGGPARPNESFNPQLGIDRVHQEAYVKELGVARGLLLAAKDELEEAKEIRKNKPIDTDSDLSTLHPEIYAKCRDLYEKGAYPEAVEKGFKVVRDRLRKLTGHETGSEAFGKGKLHIKGAAAANVDRDFNEAVKFLMMAIDRFRNEKSHTSDSKIDDPIRAYEYLRLSSLAMNLLENTEIR
ncbi:MAG: TIGR02391 family protein [Parcubacteria group bacterium]|nr:TIGR02391 family protein [Parcubacteria group bacterium]